MTALHYPAFLIAALTVSIPAMMSGRDSPKPKRCDYLPDTAAILENRRLETLLRILRSEHPTTLHEKKFIPPFIQRQLDCITGSFSLADPGEEFQEGCVVTNELPRRRLVFLALGESIMSMVYETGGWASSNHILLVRFEGGRITDLWTGLCSDEMLTNAEMVNVIVARRNAEWGLNTNIIDL